MIDIRRIISETIEEMAYPSSFSMEEFKSLPSFRQRIQYCERHLERISSGSSRIVYAIDDDKVLKLAKNKKGIEQNGAEGGDYYLQNFDCIAKVYDCDENYLWIEMERARKAKASDFKNLSGYSFNIMQYWVDYVNGWYSTSRYKPYIPEDVKSMFKEWLDSEDNWFYNSVFHDIMQYLTDYQLQACGDIKRISSWGVGKCEDGSEHLILIDYGLNDEIYDNMYRR